MKNAWLGLGLMLLTTQVWAAKTIELYGFGRFTVKCLTSCKAELTSPGVTTKALMRVEKMAKQDAEAKCQYLKGLNKGLAADNMNNSTCREEKTPFKSVIRCEAQVKLKCIIDNGVKVPESWVDTEFESVNEIKVQTHRFEGEYQQTPGQKPAQSAY